MQQASQTHLLDLPATVLQQILNLCSPAGLAYSSTACKGLREAATEQIWRRHCLDRWHSWESGLWTTLQQQGNWHSVYSARSRVDASTRDLIGRLVWPTRRYASIRSMEVTGYDALDVLRDLAVKEGHLMVGTRYWAKQALTSVLSSLLAKSMQHLLLHPETAQDSPETGALMVAQAHYPLVNVFKTEAFLDELAEECKRRMREAGVTSDLEGLQVLNQLMFALPEDGSAAPSSGADDSPRQADLPYPMSAWTWEQQQADWMKVPTGQAGLGLQGDSDSYYDPSNSLLPFVLAQRKGIPISLAVLHAAVGRRAGLPIEFVGMPMHFMNKLAAQDSKDDVFIDVFAGGRVLNRSAMRSMMLAHEIPYQESHLQPVGLAEVYTRLCGNLINIYNHSRNVAKMRILLDMLLAIQPDNYEYRLRHAQAAINRDDHETAIADYQHCAARVGATGGWPGEPPQAVLQARLQAVHTMKAAWAEEAQEQVRRPSHNKVHYKVGDVIRHKRYHYRGVIYGWDPECKAEEDWMLQMRIDQLPGGRHQPYYHVLVDHRDRPFQSTYVAQENIVRAGSGESSSSNQGGDLWSHRGLLAPHWEAGLEVQHPEIGEYFEGIEPGESCYRVNAYLHHHYPEDWIASI